MATARVNVRLRPSHTSLSTVPRSLKSLPPANSSPLLSLGATSSPASSAPRSFVGASSSLTSSARVVAAALELDPNIFQYDEAVEPVTRQHSKYATGGSMGVTSSAATSVDAAVVRPASRYIGSLVRAATQRAQQREVVQQASRLAEIEREEQMEEFKGKERFVTAAYKRALEQQSEWSAQTGETGQRRQQVDVVDGERTTTSSSQRGQGSVSETATQSAPTAAASSDLSEQSNKKRRVQSEAARRGADGSDDGATEERRLEQQQLSSEHGSEHVSSVHLSVPTSLSPASGSVGVEAEEVRKRTAARDRFLARKKAATRCENDG